MIGLLVYGLGALAGILIRIGGSRWAAAFIVATAFDGIRYQGASATNGVMAAFLTSVGSGLFMGRRIRKNRMYAPAIAFLAVAAIATLGSKGSDSPGAFLLSFSALILVACALPNVTDNTRKLRRLTTALLWMSGIVAVAVFAELALFYFFGIELKQRYVLVNLQQYYVQSSGLFASNALAALHLVPGAAVGAFLRAQSPRRRERRILAAYLALVMGALIATMARAAFVTLILIVLLLLVRTATRPGRGRIPAFLLVIVILFSLVPFLNFIAGFNPMSLAARQGIMQGAFESISRNPVLGSGPGSQVVASRPVLELEEFSAPEAIDEFSPRETHNTPLEISVDTGLLGLLVFVIINIVLLHSTFRMFKRVPPGFTRRALFALIVGLLTTEFFALFDSVLYTKPIWLLFGMLGGTLSIAREQLRRERSRIQRSTVAG